MSIQITTSVTGLSGVSPRIVYVEAKTYTLSQVTTAGFLPSNSPNNANNIDGTDIVLVSYDVATSFFDVSISNNVVTLSASSSIPDESITTEKLADESVTGDKIESGTITGDKLEDGAIGPFQLSSNLQYNYTAKFGGKFSSAGGSAAIVITATGVSSSYSPFVSVQSSANAVSIQKILAGTNQITVTFSGDPGACILPWLAFLSI